MRRPRRPLATVTLVLTAVLAAGPLAAGAVAVSPTTDLASPAQRHAYVQARQMERDFVPLAAAMTAPAPPTATPAREPLGAVAVVLVGAAGGFAGGLTAVAAWRARARLRPRRTTVPA